MTNDTPASISVSGIANSHAAMIELGLARVGRLLSESPLPWRAIHVAGTNGKGSVCAYASSMLHASGVLCGRFTSPHLVDRWDCITVNEKTVEETLFRQVESRMITRNKIEKIEASEFELLTATAFEIFAQEKVRIGVVEVGLGGRLDATNILKDPLVTVITKIGRDHENLLGDTVEKIAYQKAGIMKKGVLCIVDGSNAPSVLQILTDYTREVGAGPIVQISADAEVGANHLWNVLAKDDFEPHQQMNLTLAFEAVKHVIHQTETPFLTKQLAKAVAETSWPGRLQLLSINSLTGREQTVLLDGAHNPQSAEILGRYVDKRLRRNCEAVTWVTAVSQGKDLTGIFGHLVKPGDHVITAQFGPVEGMPWVHAASPEEVLNQIQNMVKLGHSSCSPSVKEALEWATEISREGPIVIAGSLYLVSDVLRLLRLRSPE